MLMREGCNDQRRPKYRTDMWLQNRAGIRWTSKSLLRLKEPSVLLRCRECDRNLVESILGEAKQQYAEKARVHAPNITIDKQVYLPPPPANLEEHAPYCSGGVVLASQDGKIVCENTLDARLDVVFRQKLPEIRKRLVENIAA